MVSYDTPQNTAAKVAYVRNTGLGGIMWWESSGNRSDEDSLVNLAYQGLGGFEGKHIERQTNVLDYPQSRYNNLQTGMPSD